MKRIYLSGVYETKSELCKVRAALQSMGFTVCSSWLNETDREAEVLYRVLRGEGSEEDIARARYVAEMDMDDIRECDIFVLFSDAKRPSPRGGCHIETGYAYGMGKEIWLVGDATSHFHHLVADMWFRDEDEMLRYALTLSPASCSTPEPPPIPG